jgi:hypothetical protein
MTIVISVEKKVYEKLDKLKEDIRIVIDENDEMEAELKEKDDEIKKLKLELANKTHHLEETKRLLDMLFKSKEKIPKIKSK